MRTYKIQWILALLASASAYAQRPPNNHGDRRPPPMPPLFGVLDTNHDGALSEKEMKDAPKLLERLDKNRDGQVTAEELRLPPPPPKGNGDEQKDPPSGKRPPPPVIAALDVDHDGTISAKELENASESLKELDENGDGELSPEELRPHGPPPPPQDGGEPEGPPPQGGEDNAQ